MIRIRLYLPLLISNIQRHLTSYHHTAAVCLYLHYPPNICSPLSDESRSHYALSSCLACGEETLNRDAEIHFHCSHTFTIHSQCSKGWDTQELQTNLQLSFHNLVGIPSVPIAGGCWCVLFTTSVRWPSSKTWWIHISLNLVKDLVLMRLCSVRREGKKLKLGCGAEARGRCWQQCCVDIQPGSLM